jgi:ABC-type methionine transport system ATPase subunit
MSDDDPIVRIRDARKDYRALRPLRIARLDLAPRQSLALLGLDRAMGEVLVDLIMGTTVPDSGEVVVFGTPTTAVTSGDDWLAALDRFGLVSERAVLVDRLTAEQNLAMPFSLDLDRLSPELRTEVRELAGEVGLSPGDLRAQAGELSVTARVRVRLGRALALRPRVLLAEHPSSALTGHEARALAADLSRIVKARRLAALIVTADREFGRSVAGQVLTLQPGTGELRASFAWPRWLSRRAL